MTASHEPPKQKTYFWHIGTVVLVVLLIVSARSIQDIRQSKKKLIELEENIRAEEEYNAKLQADIAYVESDEYLEKEALEKLSLTKPGKTIVIVPEATPEDYAPAPRHMTADTPNWRKWAQLFGFSKKNSVQ